MQCLGAVTFLEMKHKYLGAMLTHLGLLSRLEGVREASGDGLLLLVVHHPYNAASVKFVSSSNVHEAPSVHFHVHTWMQSVFLRKSTFAFVFMLYMFETNVFDVYQDLPCMYVCISKLYAHVHTCIQTFYAYALTCFHTFGCTCAGVCI